VLKQSAHNVNITMQTECS